MTEIKQISVPPENLLLHLENPRFEPVKSQREAIEKMVADQGNKLYELAADIVGRGLNHSESLCVIAAANESNKYVVLEGNRRITAIRLLTEPGILNGKHKVFTKKIRKLHESYKTNPIATVPCTVYESEQDAAPWVKLKHTGENDGAGTVGWDAQQKARFNAKQGGKPSYANQVIDFLMKSGYFDKDLKARLKHIKASSLDRLIGDPAMRELLGLNLENGLISGFLEEREIVKGLTKIIKDLLRKDFRVKDIYGKKDRDDYRETFKPGENPDHNTRLDMPWSLTPDPVPTPDSTVNKPKQRSKPLSTSRKTIIPLNCIILIDDSKTNKIYRELKDLEIEKFVNAGAVLLRVFIELSLDAYIDKKKLQGMGQSRPLKEKLDKVAQHMKDIKIVDDHRLKGIKSAVEKRHDVLSIDTFNAYVHNRHFAPTKQDLIVAWDNIQEFVVALWGEIDRKKK